MQSRNLVDNLLTESGRVSIIDILFIVFILSTYYIVQRRKPKLL